ncbi:MAG: type transport system permease protein, partial [Solirubrobacteraceae bacterium]|nr:type transport system permease protein [Solirubrobacteraceae bacterium]
LTGWIHTIASVNPATALLQAGRGFISGAPEHPALAFAVCAGALLVASVYAVRSLRRAEAGL